jgi:hypothetical protein
MVARGGALRHARPRIVVALEEAGLGGKSMARARARRLVLAGLCVEAGLVGKVLAVETTVGGYEVSLDTTLSSGVDLRTSAIDDRFVGQVNGGKFPLPNVDNGTLNYRPGSPVAATQRVTTELEIKREDYGLFFRATGFYDPVTDSERTDFQPLTRAAVRDIGADLRLLDAYGFARPDILGHPFDVRVGAQPINWGESTFIQFGINATAPLDVTALRTPGSELKDGILPVPAVDVRTEIGGGFSVEGFWQFAWTRDRLEPDGSFFSTSDTISDGATYGVLFPGYKDSITSVNALDFFRQSTLGAALPRLNDRQATNLDEFGLALRRSFPEFGGAELGLYFENYGSRTPLASYRTGTEASVLPSVLSSLKPNDVGPSYTSTAGYFADYVRDIHLVGTSWNVEGPAGIAIQGEYSARLNQPMQLNTNAEALAVDAPAACYLARIFGPVLGGTAAAACATAKANTTIAALGGVPGFDSIVDGWKRHPVSQIQTTATKILQGYPSLGISTITLIGEIGFDYVHGFPRDRHELDYPYQGYSGFAFQQPPGSFVFSPSRSGLPSAFAGAYTVVSVFDMPAVLPYAIGMRPFLSLQHDFVGSSPEGVNVFVQNTAAASLGVSFTYLQAWSLSLQYTNHFPVFDGGKAYGLIDRDFVSALLAYEL